MRLQQVTRFRHPRHHGGHVRIRRAGRSVGPSPTELQEPCDASGNILTEESAIQDATPSHIDPDAFRSWLPRPGFDATADLQPDSEDKLRIRAVIVESGGELPATLYGVLAFGGDPERYLETRNSRDARDVKFLPGESTAKASRFYACRQVRP